MSAEYEEEYYNEEIEEYSDEHYQEILEEYRRRRLKETLIGPVISTVFHIGLILILAIFIVDKYKKEAPEIVVTMEQIEEVKIEEPPPVEEPIPEEVETTDVTEPVLTTIAIENVETNEAALEDVSDEAPSTDDDNQVEAISDVVVSPSAFASPSVFGGRSAAGRAGAVSKFGGSKVGQQSLLKALWWLAKVQNPDGSWGTDGQPAYTGLALLTFLAHGETQTSQSFGKTVKKAMEWLVNSPVETKKDHGYPHAIKTYAIAEAYAMTGVSILGEKMEECIEIIIDGIQDGGSYNYHYDKDESKKQDLSFAGWNYQALKAAYGAGCSNSELLSAIEKGVAWLKKHAASSDKGKGFPYAIKNGERKVIQNHTMRAVGCLCLQLFGEGATPEMTDELLSISTEDYQNLNWANPPKAALYGWYYATQAMFQAGGEKWKSWNKKFQKVLIDNQNPEGFWEYPGRRHGKGDELTTRVYATTLCALQLTVYYRYLPSTKVAIGNKEKKETKEKELIIELNFPHF